MRNSFTQNPSQKEMQKIFETEAFRAMPPGKEDKHYVSLDPFIEFLEDLGFNVSVFSKAKDWHQVLEHREKTQREIVELILNQEPDKIADQAQKVYKYLSEEDGPGKSDFIFAFGARTDARAKKAIELFKKGLAPKLLFSGRTAIWDNRDEIEAERYKQLALEAGVPDSAIIVEPEAITLPDNVRRSLNLLDERSLFYKSIILVNSPYSQRRGYAHVLKYTPEGTMVYRVNCETREGLRENDWFKNEEGIKYIVNEFGKMWMALITNTI